ncbi:NAD(P)-dependent oxidoreductase [Macrococcus sp. DPC7161]|uniref:NAD(P)-dependent oxidoreductase n=1 Tax=Macrococcus sp. DPC7161 TaxID=2507060 RepID=UPI00100B60B9|nr:NAD(P)-dependent oxidoreductase [Macrococcus sp. DPC7161]RXK17734.1 hydroxyacid dehydrogenase [Macrococcus sp. DPC7161]
MYIISTVKLGNILDDLKHKFPNHQFKQCKLDELTDKDKENVEILISYDNKVDEKFLKSCKNLKWIAWYAAGVNHLPLDYIKSRDIILTNAKGVHKIQISEYIMSYIMTDYKSVIDFYELQQEKGYQTKIRHKELFNETICFLGTGQIAQAAAQKCKAFDMHVIGVNTDGRAVDSFDETYPTDDRQTAFKKSNIIVNVLPETKDTFHLISKQDFEAMGDEALFINVGRGSIVEEKVLVDVLKNNIIRKAAIDVYENEPLSPENDLYTLKNIIMTPHITGLSQHYNTRATEIFEFNLDLGIENKQAFKNLVNLEAGY